MMHGYKVVAGIDVAKEHVDVAFERYGEVRRFKTTKAGLQALVAHVQAHEATHVVIEATGPYSAPIADVMWAAEIPITIANPRQCRQFAEGLGLLEKNDSIDARMLSFFGQTVRPPASVPLSESRKLIRALLDRKAQVVQHRIQEQQRLESAAHNAIRTELRRSLKAARAEEKRLTDRIQEALEDAAKPVAELANRLQSVPGIGPAAVAALLAYVPELGEVQHRQLSKLVGVAPLCQDSGRKSGQRRVRGGRKTVRCAMYMPTISAMRNNPVIRSFNERLKAKNKPGKVRVIACMRKLLSMLNAMARDGDAWAPHTAPAIAA